MIVCITEKPSVAKDIAAILGARVRREGYYEGDDSCPYKVTWTFGHLCCLKDPGDYKTEWRSWNLATLPMIPQRFSIKLIPQASIERQFRVIESLISQADEVINCGDAGQEGELIQRWVMQKAGVKCPVKRLWISSLTDDSIRAGFENLHPQQDYDNLYYAGLSRAVGDWLLGMNATRLYTLKYSRGFGNVLSVGRVQTPTLALIVQRHFEIANFTPEDYWELRTTYRDVVFNGQGVKFKTEADAAAMVERLTGKPFAVTDVTAKKGREEPPRLFDLTTLQVECNKKWGWSADDTLRHIQSLYEKKLTTYPRVDTTYLSEDIYPKIPKILSDLTPYASLTAPVLAGKIPKSKKVFDNSKVTDHHAIIPTGESPAMLVGDERKMYHMIALRFIGAFYPPCQFTTTTVNGVVDNVKFKVTGKVITDPGWRVLYANEAKDSQAQNDDSADKILPPFVVGESGPHQPFSVKKTTQPPKYYNEGTLLRAMESAGKSVDDEDLREAMKENGIGRPSTRAAIIETLFKRKYIYRDRKSIMASQAGIDLINTIKEDLIKSAKLTGIWENKLRRIERGEYSAAEFVTELKAMVQKVVIDVLNDFSNRLITVSTEKPKKERAPRKKSVARKSAPTPPQTLDQIKCPKCGQGHIIMGRTAYGCSRYADGCDLRLYFTEYAPTLTPAQLAEKLEGGAQSSQ